MRDTDRRRFLVACGVALGSFAGCAARNGPTATPDETETASPTPTSTDTTATDTPTDRASETQTPSGPAPGVAWKHDVDATIGEVAAAGDVALVGTDAGGVRAFAGDGRERWSATVEGPVQQLDSADGRVLAVSGTNELFSSHTVRALDAASGEPGWEFAPEEWWLTVLGTHDGTAYVATADDAIEPGGQTLYALSLDDGSVRWSGEVGDNLGGLVTDDAVYVPTWSRLYAFGHDGTERFRRDVADYGSRSLVAVGDTVAFAGAV